MTPSPLHTPLCDRLGMRVPVVLAPMAGGVSTPELGAAVVGAGGLASFGAYGMRAADVHSTVRRALELAGPPVAVNVLLAPDEAPAADAARLAALLRPFREELGLGEPEAAPPAPPGESPEALVEAGLAAGATAVSVGMGEPGAVGELARAAGVPLLAGASTVEEARRWADAGADAIVAQGAEAGGHRMTPGPGDAPPPLVGTFALVPQVVDAVDVPVIAAGGIMDGRGLAAALALGAQGVAMGTRFLLTEESALPPFLHERMLSMSSADTVVTDRVTGRPGRWIRGRLVDALAGGAESLGWPAQRYALADVRAAAGRAGDADLFPMLSGQGAPLAGRTRPAADVVAEVVAEAQRILSGGAPPS